MRRASTAHDGRAVRGKGPHHVRILTPPSYTNTTNLHVTAAWIDGPEIKYEDTSAAKHLTPTI